jgi:hypothetical protein
MNFLTKTLSWPEMKKKPLLIPVGYPAEDCCSGHKEKDEDICVFYWFEQNLTLT